LVQNVIDRLDADGNPTSNLVIGGEQLLGTYVNHHGREVEIVASPEEADAAIGLTRQCPS